MTITVKYRIQVGEQTLELTEDEARDLKKALMDLVPTPLEPRTFKYVPETWIWHDDPTRFLRRWETITAPNTVTSGDVSGSFKVQGYPTIPDEDTPK